MNWWENVLLALIGIIGGFISGGWFQKRKAKAEAEGSEVDNLKEIIVTWREAYADLKVQREEFNKQLINMQKENVNVGFEVIVLKRKVKQLECENNRLKKEINKLKP